MGEPFGIGQAVKEMQQGKHVRRAGWNGKGMWLALVRGVYEDGHREARELSTLGSGWGEFRMLDYVVMKTAGGEFVPWLCSQTDLLAVDWEVAA